MLGSTSLLALIAVAVAVGVTSVLALVFIHKRAAKTVLFYGVVATLVAAINSSASVLPLHILLLSQLPCLPIRAFQPRPLYDTLRPPRRQPRRQQATLHDVERQTKHGFQSGAALLLLLVASVRRSGEVTARFVDTLLDSDFETLESSSCFQIFVQIASRPSITLDVQATSTVGDIKIMVESKDGIPANQQRFLFGGKEPEDDVTLASLDVQKEATVHVTCRLEGGGQCFSCLGRGRSTRTFPQPSSPTAASETPAQSNDRNKTPQVPPAAVSAQQAHVLSAANAAETTHDLATESQLTASGRNVSEVAAAGVGQEDASQVLSEQVLSSGLRKFLLKMLPCCKGSRIDRNQKDALREKCAGSEAVTWGDLSPVLKLVTNLVMDNNSIGAEGAKELAQAMAAGQLSALQVLNLRNNSIGVEGAKELAQAMAAGQLSALQILRLDGDPRDAEWGGEIPEAVLGRGWLEVVRYLLKLEEGAGLLKRVRLQVMGAGRVGKTSLVRALGAEDGKTEAIDVDDRTVGILVEELVLGEATGVMWDLAGQQEYRALHAALISARCVAMLLFSANEDAEEAKRRLIEWVRMVGAQCPGVRIVLVCTHAGSAKRGSETVEQFASAVEHGVRAELAKLNRELVKEVARLEELKADVEQRVEAHKQKEAQMKEGGTKATEEEGMKVEEEGRALEEERRVVGERLRAVVDAKRKEAKQLALLGDQAWSVDSITGQGVCALRAWLVEEVAKLPFMRERLPWRFLQVKEEVEEAQKSMAKVVLSRADVLSSLELEDKERWEGMSEEEAWEAVEFFSELGEWKVHRDTVVPDLSVLMELTRALAFYCPLEALRRMTDGEDLECDRAFVPGFRELEEEEQTRVREAAEAVEWRAELPEPLLAKLHDWRERGAEERGALMAVLEQMDLVVPLADEGGGRRWLLLLRLESTTWRAGADIEFEGNIVPNKSNTFICSFPGIHSLEWKKLTQSPEISTCCVFFPDSHALFGKHSDPCQCAFLYGEQVKWGCEWFRPWRELFKEGIKLKQQPIVLRQRKNYPGSNPPDRLGHSQKGEVKFAEECLEDLRKKKQSDTTLQFEDIESRQDLWPTILPAEDERGPSVLYVMHNIPAGLYSRVLAALLRLSADERVRGWEELGKRRSNRALAATFTTTHRRSDTETHRFVSVEVRDEGLQVQSSSVAMLAEMCRVVEKLLAKQFVGMPIRTLVSFTDGAKRTFQLDTSTDVEGQKSTFGQILHQKLWHIKVTGKLVGEATETTRTVTVEEVLGGEQAVLEFKRWKEG